MGSSNNTDNDRQMAPQPVTHYVCPARSHTYTLPEGWSIRLVLSGGWVREWATDNLCPMCFTEWLSGMFPTKEVQQ